MKKSGRKGVARVRGLLAGVVAVGGVVACSGASSRMLVGDDDGGPSGDDAAVLADATTSTDPKADAATGPSTDGSPAPDVRAPDAGGGDATVPTDCRPGVARCAANSAQVCATDGTWGAPGACVGQTCVGGQCVGVCAPGEAKCQGNSLAHCSSGGAWTVPIDCGNATCVDPGLDGGAGASAASCQGVCVRGVGSCSGTQPLVCGSDGLWADGGATCAGGAPVCTSGACTVCQPNEVGCGLGQQPQRCSASGDGWQPTRAACSGTTPVCLAGSCVACSPGDVGCDGQQPRTCSAAGVWQNAGSACKNQACVAGICTGVCTPGTQGCSGNSAETCSSSGQWSAPVACAGTAKYCVGGICSTTPVPPSCAPGGDGMTNCGGGADNCCTSLPVPGGSYDRSYSASAGASAASQPATVSSFRLDKYEITVGRYRQFVNYLVAGGAPPAAGSGKHTHLNGGGGLAITGAAPSAGGALESGWIAAWNVQIPNGASAASTWNTNLTCPGGGATWTASPGGNETRPVSCLTWQEAYAFCVWDGGFLPTYAEWGYAAAGGGEQRLYPWGSAPLGTANKYAIYNCLFPWGGSRSCTGVANVAPVGSAPLGAGKWGQLDLAGNINEWNLDWRNNPIIDPCVDCATMSDEGYTFVAGGCFADSDTFEANALRSAFPADQRDTEFGARCARVP